jgi:hypothetical protein
MPANSPEEICALFQQYMRDGDIEFLTFGDQEKKSRRWASIPGAQLAAKLNAETQPCKHNCA